MMAALRLLARSAIGPAGVAELVDALDLGSSGESRGGSIPSARTIEWFSRARRRSPGVALWTLK
jgi:hypothetical protein